MYVVNSKKFRAYISSLIKDDGDYYLLLDEIQLLDSFVGTLNGFISHANYDVYVTGSNSQMLSSEVETKFRGRKTSIHVLPLTFKELIDGLGVSPVEAWQQYIVTGGVAVSGLEMAQNPERSSWSFEEVDKKLHSITKEISRMVISTP